MTDNELFSKTATQVSIIQASGNLFFAGPYKSQITCSFENKRFQITIEQLIARTISITSEKGFSTVNELWRLFNLFDEFMMLFEGKFAPIAELTFSGGDTDLLIEAARRLKTRRLSMYFSADFMQGSPTNLLNFHDEITDDIFESWLKLSKELSIIHSMFLYNTADTSIPIDLKCAHLIEIFEPLAELVGTFDPFFPTLNSDDRTTTLKGCIDAVISKYGQDIFKREFETDKERFLKLLVWSRNRIMHIKRNWSQDKYLSGKESVIYAAKISCLYRRVLLELIGVDYSRYRDAVISYISQLDSLNGIVDYFFSSKLTL